MKTNHSDCDSAGCGVAAGVYYYPRLTNKPAPVNQLTLSGNIEAHESLVGFKVPGRIVELPVEEGQQVAQGALLARLDDADLQAASAHGRSHGARARIESCAHAGRDTRAGSEGGAADDDRCRGRSGRRRSSTTSARKQLFAKDEVSAQERDQAATALKRAEAIFKAAQQRYNEAVEGSRKEDIAIARANLNEANASLGLSQVNLSYTVLRAPSAGVVTVRQAELGEVVAPGSPVVTLADLDHIWLRAYVAETDLGTHSLGPGRDDHHRHLSGQAIPRAHLVHLIRRGVYAQERADISRSA